MISDLWPVTGVPDRGGIVCSMSLVGCTGESFLDVSLPSMSQRAGTRHATMMSN